MARGLILIVVAVLLGVFVLQGTDEPPALAEDETLVGAGTIAEDEDEEEDAAAVDRTEVGRADDEAETPSDDEAARTTEDEVAGTTEEREEPEEGETGSTTTTTTTAAGVRPPAEVSVLVANGSGEAGLAGELSDQVGDAGYETAEPSNVREDVTVPASAVYHADGYEAEAAALAATLTPVPPVAPFPDPAPVDDLRGATILLVVGPDLAAG